MGSCCWTTSATTRVESSALAEPGSPSRVTPIVLAKTVINSTCQRRSLQVAQLSTFIAASAARTAPTVEAAPRAKETASNSELESSSMLMSMSMSMLEKEQQLATATCGTRSRLILLRPEVGHASLGNALQSLPPPPPRKSQHIS